MLERFLRRSKIDNYSNHRSNPYEETMCGVRVCITLRPQTLYVETLPLCISESGRPLIKVNRRGAFRFSPNRQQMGERRYLQSGISSYESDYKRFSTIDSITTEKIVNFIYRFSMTIQKKTFIVLDNAKTHHSKIMMVMRKTWEKKGMYPFSCLHIPLILIKAKHFGEFSKTIGFCGPITLQLNHCSMLFVDSSRHWEQHPLSGFINVPDILINSNDAFKYNFKQLKF